MPKDKQRKEVLFAMKWNSSAIFEVRPELVGVRGFEPPAPASRTQCSTRLSYTPMKLKLPRGGKVRQF